MFRRRHAIVASLALPALAVLTAGCEDEDKAIPQVIFEGSLMRGTAADCRDSGQLFTIGNFGNPAAEPPTPAQPVKNGDGNVSVSCSVRPVGGDEFEVDASADLATTQGGFFRINGRFKTSGEQQQIQAEVASRFSTNRYLQRDRGCVVRYTTPFQGVAAGRVWGDVSCPKAENVKTNDGSACEIVAQFRFENCAQ